MTKREAWLYAAEWGSYMHSGDPGTCMYGFNERFEVQSEEHRQACVVFIDECIHNEPDRARDFNVLNERSNLLELREMVINAELTSAR